MSSNKLIAIALALSGLVHGVLLITSSDHTGEQVGKYTQLISLSLQPAQQLLSDKPARVAQENFNQQDEIKKHVPVEAQELVEQAAQKPVVKIVDNASVEKQPDQKMQDITEPEADSSTSQQVAREMSPVIEPQLSGEKKRLLLSLLHEKINEYKRYPYIAVRQRREGLVKVNFILHPDGHISDVIVSESSRYAMLDRAATRAVEKVPPLSLASNYLQHSEAFNVDIDFRLN